MILCDKGFFGSFFKIIKPEIRNEKKKLFGTVRGGDIFVHRKKRDSPVDRFDNSFSRLGYNHST